MNEAVQVHRLHQRKNLKEIVYDVLRSRILMGDLKPGEKLSIDDLLHEFKTSRSPLKEAIAQLQVEGLVDVHPQSGSFVTAPDARQISENFAVRKCLELCALDSLVADMSPEQEAELNVWRQGPSEEVAANIKSIKAYDLDFHRFIIAASQNQELVRIYDVLSTKIMLVIANPTGHLAEAGWRAQHVPTIEAVLDRDLKAARQALAAHLDEACERLVSAYHKDNRSERLRSKKDPG